MSSFTSSVAGLAEQAFETVGTTATSLLSGLGDAVESGAAAVQDGLTAIVEEADSIIGGPPAKGGDSILSSGSGSARRDSIDYFAPVPDYRRDIFARQPGSWEGFNRAV